MNKLIRCSFILVSALFLKRIKFCCNRTRVHKVGYGLCIVLCFFSKIATAALPSSSEWDALAIQLTGRLIKPVSVIEPCKSDASLIACTTTLKKIHNPFYLDDTAGATQSQGWFKAWDFSNSSYAVEAINTKDVVAAVKFARNHRIKLVIKGTGHDYLGRSNAVDSLLVWTHKMRQVQSIDAFVPTGCPNSVTAVPAVKVSAGTQWLQAYDEVSNKHGRYVQGGGCTTVGAAGGFTQGGGFGSFSKKFGTGAGGVLEAEVVMADGAVLIANQCQNQDLFWAIRGGGAGTFGVVTHMTLKTHSLPKSLGILQGTIAAKTDEAYKVLIEKFIHFYRRDLNNEHWGEQIAFNPSNKIDLFLVYQELTPNQAKKTWDSFSQWVKKNPNLFTLDITLWSIPPRKLWDMAYWQKNHPEMVTQNRGENAVPGQYWWTPNSKEVFNYWYTYQSWWLPLDLMSEKNTHNLANLFYKASRLAKFSLHINKGLAGASPMAVKQADEIAFNPAVYDAAALVIMAAGSNQVYPGVLGHEPEPEVIKKIVEKINRTMKLFVDAAPYAGAYANEADYFQKDWQRAFWGRNYAKLLKIKKKYDVSNFFNCHHCVGSE